MTDQELIKEKMESITDLLLRKNRDYGSSFRKPGILSGALDSKSKLLVRIDDKLERLGNLLEKNSDGDVPNESMSDTVNDLIGYFVLVGILLDEQKQAGRPMSVIEAGEMRGDEQRSGIGS
ncbi:MAG: hypothetical protein BWY28_02760 [bacterium ADurb.Bin236]|nr:MAG: hypothetical protein BWY28_02760 [bacterium ADurb.Bin236]HPN95971.1 nucleotide modification associated domain-containing protein [bacterium]